MIPSNTQLTSIPHNPPSPLPRRLTARQLLPIGIILLTAVAIVFVQLSDLFEGNFKALIDFFILIAAVLLLTIWLLFFSGWRLKTRLILFAVELLVIAGGAIFVSTLLVWQGSLSGNGVPRLVWKWTPQPDAGLKPLKESGDAVVQKVDLTTTTPPDFPEFLGPGRQNQLSGVGLSRDWSQNHAPRLLWRQPVGLGWGSFAVVNGFAITQEQRGDRELVTCLQVQTGQICWQHANTARFSENMGGDGPRATPTIRDGRVYVMGATGILDCLDGATGHAIWSRNILADTHSENLGWGKSCSPLVYDDLVVVSGGARPADNDKRQLVVPTLLAYDRRTGSKRWAQGEGKASYSSPALATVNGRSMVLTVNAQSVCGHDAADGKVLWTYKWPGNWPKASQAIAMPGDRVFISAGYGLGAVMLGVEEGAHASSVVAPVWTSLHMKTEFTNILVHHGSIYGLDDGVLTCLDPANGKRRWRDGRYGHGQILGVDNLILIQAEDGRVALVEATPGAFLELGSFPALSRKTWNNPALFGHKLLVRNDREMACYELP